MIKLDDPIWDALIGGYRTLYNASVRLQELENGLDNADEIWEEFWNELHHQGDVDIASYAVVPQLVRICIKRQLLDWNALRWSRRLKNVECLEKTRNFRNGWMTIIIPQSKNWQNLA